MTKEENTSKIPMDLCKICFLILIGLNLTQADLVHLL